MFEKFQDQRVHWVRVFEKSDSMSVCSRYLFPKLQRTPGFHERTDKDPVVLLGRYLIVFQKQLGIMIRYIKQLLLLLFVDNCDYISRPSICCLDNHAYQL